MTKQELFIDLLYNKYGNKYDFSKIALDYKSNKEKFIVTDNNTNIQYLTRLNDLQQGSEPTVLSAVDKTDWFIKNSRLVHGNKYNYSKSVYEGTRTKITLICNYCQLEFKQNIQNHLKRVNGCPDCAKTNAPGTYLSISRYNPNEEVYLYFLLLYNDGESFYKIGLTKNVDVSKRCRVIPYKFEILGIEKGVVSELFDLEQKIHMLMRNKRQAYIPKIKFAGYTECFTI